ncbi:MAG: ATP-binding protein [Solirubrobacteraceae bacterium MAG38_C4-C5]|nr:ATP-binding protein [Candidatus Siliceabacter maunaloa]
MSRRLVGWEALGVALLRVLLVPIAALIRVSDPRPWSEQADWILLGAVGYAVVVLGLALRASSVPPGGWRPYAVLDMLFVGLLAWQSGGAFSEMRAVLAALPFVVAFVGRPRSTAAFAVLSVGVYLAAAEAPAGTPDSAYVAAEGLLIAWCGGLAILLNVVITRARDQALALAAERQHLVEDTQGAIERERQLLAYRLHDDAIQSLQAARLQLDRAGRGDPAALDGAREAITDALEQLRDTVADLRPADVERVGLSNALHQTALRLLDQAQGVTPQVEIDVTPDVEGIDDELWFALARELLANAVAHSHARHITLTLARIDDHISLAVDDDGHGMQPGRRRQARREGHIGLASCAERAAAHGGTFDISSQPGRGTNVAATLPIRLTASSGNRS